MNCSPQAIMYETKQIKSLFRNISAHELLEQAIWAFFKKNARSQTAPKADI
jgi:hypothetical protein